MEELIPIVAIFFVIGVPVMALAARFALRPLLRDFAAALGKGEQSSAEVAELTRRLAHVEGHLLEQDRRLNQLVEAELFRRRLEEPREGPRLGAHPPAESAEDPARGSAAG